MATRDLHQICALLEPRRQRTRTKSSARPRTAQRRPLAQEERDPFEQRRHRRGCALGARGRITLPLSLGRCVISLTIVVPINTFSCRGDAAIVVTAGVLSAGASVARAANFSAGCSITPLERAEESGIRLRDHDIGGSDTTRLPARPPVVPVAVLSKTRRSCHDDPLDEQTKEALPAWCKSNLSRPTHNVAANASRSSPAVQVALRSARRSSALVIERVRTAPPARSCSSSPPVLGSPYRALPCTAHRLVPPEIPRSITSRTLCRSRSAPTVREPPASVGAVVHRDDVAGLEGMKAPEGVTARLPRGRSRRFHKGFQHLEDQSENAKKSLTPDTARGQMASACESARCRYSSGSYERTRKCKS